MAALPDLITQPQLLGFLADLPLSAAQLASLPALTASASESIRVHCKRAFTLATFDELYTVDSPSTTLILRQFPVTSVDRCCTNPTAVLTVEQTDTRANQRATVTLTTSGDEATGLVVTGVTLNRWASGVKTSHAVPVDDSHPTVQSLADAVNLYGQGWSAAVNTGYALWPSADLRAVQGARPAMGPNGGADLCIHADDLDFNLNERTGVLRLSPADASSADSPRFGPPFVGADEDVPSYGGFQGLRVVYTAGWASVPADVQLATAEAVKAAAERLNTDSTLQSESDGVLSWSARGELLPLPRQVLVALAPRVNTRA